MRRLPGLDIDPIRVRVALAAQEVDNGPVSAPDNNGADMGNRSRRERRSRAEARTGRIRADAVAIRLGVALRESRRAGHLTQAHIAHAAGVSQGLVSYLECGHGASATIETWACLAAAVGEQFVGFLERVPGADRPRDIEHLRRQSALIALAAKGGWRALPELAIDSGIARSRSIDVALVRTGSREAVVAEVWDWFDDVGAALRGLDAKVQAVAGRLEVAADRHEGGEEPWRIQGLFVVRATRRNRRLVGELRPLFAARFSGSSRAWLEALADPASPMPAADGLIWSTAVGTGLTASRLGGGA